MKPLLLVGCGGHARSVIDIIESEKKWKIHGLIGMPHEVGTYILGYEVIGTDENLLNLRNESVDALLTVGQILSSRDRRRLASKLNDLGFNSPVIISPYAVVSKHSVLGAGTIVGHGAIINAEASVGIHCTINSRALIEHNAKINDHCHISTGVLVNGGVNIGSDSFIGSGAMIRNGLSIPEGSIISAGTRVMGWPLI